MKYHLTTQKLNHYFIWQNFTVKGSQSKNVVKAPVVTEVTEQLIGLAQPKQWIKVTTQDEVFFTQANHEGIWHLDNPIAQGGTASIVALGAFGKISKAIEIAVAVPAPSFLDVPVITEKNLWLKGTAEPLSNVVIQHEEAIYQVRADAEGNWEIENPIYWGGSITLYAENAQGLTSAIIGLAVLPPFPPSVPNILEDGAYLVGTADVNSVVVLRHNGVETRIEIGADGHWSVLNPIYGVGGYFNLYAENEYGLKSPEIGLATLPPLPPSVPNITERGKYLVGTADADSIVVLRHNGVETRIEVDADGHWSVLNPIYGVGGYFNLYAENEYGLKSPEIGLAALAPLPPSVPNITERGKYLVGTADADSIVVLRHNGVETRIEVGVDGQWSVLNPIYGVGGSLYLYAENQFGIKSLEIGLAALKIIPTSPSVLENTEILAGLADPQHKIIVTSQNEQYVTYSNAEGHWQIENPIKNGGFASIVAENIYGTTSQPYAVIKLQIQTLEAHELVDLGGLLTQMEDQQQQMAQEFDAEVNTTLIDLLDSESHFETILLEQAVSNRVETSVEISLQRHDPIYDPFTQTQWVA